ncbi:HD domain-containing phosphohydrolase [Methylomonas rivi]|uniref:Response regulator n=1 Tax=Methylomonas rivi TaxID=2952226 RepID=A0ABT1U2N8_9GAMM|nr:HD domain-containing phosphohydrolase [Methylomonas sp. WSC-6]MCQ8128099.1 response regulator [Methylomonas sp. WSC-6]
MSPSADISQKILFVDDEILLLKSIKRQFRREFDITVAESGAAGLAALTEQGPFAVVVSDYNMPGMDGVQFLNAVYRRQPESVLVMLTGRADLDLAIEALHNAHISRFLNKPCPKQILQDTLSDGLEQYRLRMSERLLQAQLQQANQELNLLNNRLEILVAEKTRALQLQYRHVANLARMTHSHTVIAALIAAVTELTRIESMSLWLSPHLDHRFTRHHPMSPEPAQCDLSACPPGLMANILQNKQIWLHQPASRLPIGDFDQRFFPGPPLMSVPLHSKKGVLGLLNLAGEPKAFSADILDALAGIVDVTTTALQSHWHREAFEEAQDAIITALAKLSEYRDPETGAHLLRLKKYCGLICRALANNPAYRENVTPEFTEDLIRSSPLHDIGKVGIPDAILKKPGRLTAEEFEIMKNHAAIGGDTLRAVYDQYPSQSFIQCGMDVAYCHHEKWNGSGYPQGLKGDAIPLAARILALVDVYDALTCRRVYKVPFPPAQAKAIILEGSGTHFDPGIVAAFLAIEDEFQQIAEQYADVG